MNSTATYAAHRSHHGFGDSHHISPSAGAQYYAAQPQYAPVLPSHSSSYVSHAPQHYAYAPYAALHHPANQYNQYPHPAFGHGMTATLPSISTPGPSATLSCPAPPEYPQRQPDTSGQLTPPHLPKPKCTATLWEDERTMCFQVESTGICVARRADNHMINGTKLLNVAKMTRGRRDGILKTEKNRRVVKIGPMHLKGVWISFDRALEMANKEKITELLYPLFVHDIDKHLVPTSSAAMAGSGLSQAVKDAQFGNTKQSRHMQESVSQLPALTQRRGVITPPASRTAHARAPESGSSGRPSLDRAHTYPTPPTVNSSVTGLGHGNSSYEYGAQQTGHQHFPDSKSMPTTPASTPPSVPVVPSQYASTPVYEVARGNPSYSASSLDESRYPASVYDYAKTSMGPPSKTIKDGEIVHSGYHAMSSQMVTDNLHSSPQNKGSPHHLPSLTPRSSGVVTPYSHWHGSYNTPQRARTLPSSGLAYPSSSNGHANGQEPNIYPTPYSSGVLPTYKRGRDADDEDGSSGDHEDDFKRRQISRPDFMPRPVRR